MQTNEFNKAAAIKQAQEYLRATKSEKEIELDKQAVYALASAFQSRSIFSYARRLFQLLHQQFPKDEKIIEKLAVCTYKDSDLSSEVKFDAAAKLLITNFEDEEGKIINSNVLGVLGGIFKNKWKYDNHTGHLYQSLRYYLEGYKQANLSKEQDLIDMSYCGINAAFVYDQLARLEIYQVKEGQVGYTTFERDPLAPMIKDFLDNAKQYRKDICAKFDLDYPALQENWKTNPDLEQDFQQNQRFWYFASWAEALLGLAKFDEACEKFALALGFKAEDNVCQQDQIPLDTIDVPAWKQQSTRRQCYELIELLYGREPAIFEKAKKAMRALLPSGKIPAHQNMKLGLALSGGGFRASIFHIGVLAKLAEADLLRKVEVISCVSGGSILGAYYYLKLKNLVESKPKDSLTKQDYIKLVSEMETEFVDKVKNNIRVNVLSNLWGNIKISLFGKYTRSNRTAELYDKYLYKDLLDKPQIFMNHLFISPGGDQDFRPDRDNWMMENKVPILILNATTLNTGHSWQFTASWMGESPAYMDSEYDILPNLRRMYYSEAPDGYKQVPLSTAVTASAGVPGLFAPIEFDELYEGTKVLLVDGGVHDNQGMSTLYEQECNTLIISDASGQLTVANKPPDSEFGVFSRTNSILQERIRYSQFRDLESRKQSGLVRDYILMHLTKGLPGEVVNWKNCDDPYVPPFSRDSGPNNPAVLTDYLIRKKIQLLLARIRTDLDAFHESEAYGLMYSGYMMTAHEIKLASSPFLHVRQPKPAVDESDSSPWNFMKIKQVLDDSELSARLERKLVPSANLVGKVLELSSVAKYLLFTLLGIAAVGLILLVPKIFNADITIASLIKFALPFVLIIVVERVLSKVLKVRSFALCFGIWMPIFLFIWVLSALVRHLTTRWYLRNGALPMKST